MLKWKMVMLGLVIVGLFNTILLFLARANPVPEVCSNSHKSGRLHLLAMRRTDQDQLLLESELASGTKPVGRFQVFSTALSDLDVSLAHTSCGCTKVMVNGRPAVVGDRWALRGGQRLDVVLQSNLIASVRQGSWQQTATFEAVHGDNKSSVVLDWKFSVLADVEVFPKPVQVRAFENPEPDIIGGTAKCRVAIRKRDCEGIECDEAPVLECLPAGTTVSEVRRLYRKTLHGSVIEDMWECDLLSDYVTNTRFHEAYVRDSGVDGVLVKHPFRIEFQRLSQLLYPTVLDMGTVGVGGVGRRRVAIMHTGVRAFTVSGLRSSNPSFVVHKSTTEMDFGLWIEVEFRPMCPGPQSSKIVVTADQHGCQEAVIDCFGTGEL